MMRLTIQFKSVVFVLIAGLLSSCVAAVVAGAAAGLVYDKRSVIAMEADARIFHVVHTGIVTDVQFRGSRILVTSFNHIVLLVGQTPTASLRVVAENIARSAPSVKRVYDEVSVSNPTSWAQRSQDAWITGQVRSSMLAKKGLESGSIRIVTENGTVFLMGRVTPEQATLAVDVARRIKGVNKVVKIFEYVR